MSMQKVRIVEDGLVVNRRITARDDVVQVEPATAGRLIADGLAAPADVAVRLTQSCLFDGVWREAGAVVGVTRGGAVDLHRAGRAEILDRREIGEERLPAIDRPIKPLPRRVDPFAGEPTIPVRALRDFVAGTRVCTPGEGVVEVYESVAVRAVACGSAEFAGNIERLSYAASRLLQKLLTPRPQAEDDPRGFKL